MVPMRDGVRLATNIYRPAAERESCGRQVPCDPGAHAIRQRQRRLLCEPLGQTRVCCHTPGRTRSIQLGRIWRFFRDDIHDGYDTAKWIGSQPWSNCTIGTVGGSYPGGTQHALALSNPPCLKAMIPAYATSDTGRVGLRNSGAFELRWMNWIFNLFEAGG